MPCLQTVILSEHLIFSLTCVTFHNGRDLQTRSVCTNSFKNQKDNKSGYLTRHFIHLVPDVSHVQSCEKELTPKTAKLSQDSPGL